MKKILIINGPNLNMLGLREKKHYGTMTLEEINNELQKRVEGIGYKLLSYQSNHEGSLIDFIQQHHGTIHGILINPGALTHYGYSLRDALIDANVPIVEVHLSDINTREAHRKISVVADIAIKTISGLKEKSYYQGLEALISYIENK